MRRKNTAHQQDIDDLKKQNKDLEAQSNYLNIVKLLIRSDIIFCCPSIYTVCSLQNAKALQLGGLRAQAGTGKSQHEESEGPNGEENPKDKRTKKKMKMST